MGKHDATIGHAELEKGGVLFWNREGQSRSEWKIMRFATLLRCYLYLLYFATHSS